MRHIIATSLIALAVPIAAAAVPTAAAAESAPAYQRTVGGTLTRIDAIAPDIVRIRVSRIGTLPEDASWAVLPAMRTARVAVTPAADGFATAAMQVRVDPATGAISIADAAGKPMLTDAAPPSYDGQRFTLNKRLGEAEHIFGLGDKTGPLDRRGRSFTLWNTDAGITETRDPTYKSIPFYLSVGGESGAYGVLLDNTWRSWFDFGHRAAGVTSFGADGGPIDYYVIAGGTPARVVERYADLTGHPPLMPKWALGYQQSRFSYMSADEVRSLVDRFRADRFPLDVMWLDIDYQYFARPFTTDPKTFPDMGRLVRDVGGKGVKIVAITDLHIAKAPGQGYAPYDEGLRQDRFVHAADGSVFEGWVWPGTSVFPDFTQDAARRWWGTLYKDFVRDGVAGFWNDMNEPALFNVPSSTMPLDAVHRIDGSGFAPRTATHAEVHNVFGMQNFRGTYEGLEKLRPNERPFVMTRATFAGGQRWAATWTGDNYSSWSQLRLAISMTLNLGLSGFAWTANDVGGFGGGPSPDLLTRWFQVATFMPIFRDHATKGSPPQEPWVHGPEQEAIRRAYVEERYRLFPYFYALAEETHRTGAPMMRPLFYDHPEMVNAPCDTGASFALGRSLVIAGNAFGESPAPYDACLPKGRWFDYWTDAEATTTVRDNGPFGKQDVVRLTPRADTLPVFVREGTILPKQPLVQSLSDAPVGPLDLHVWPGPDCTTTLYDDDGKADPDRRRAYRRQAVSCTGAMGGNQVTLAFAAAQGAYRPWWRAMRVTIHGWPATSASRGTVDPAKHTVTLTLPASIKPSRIVITS
jgi:alpha-glucosidase